MAKATTTPKTVMPQVVISIDFGGSDTKVIAEKVPVENAKDVLGKSHSFSFAMSPEVSVVSAESLRDYTNSRIGNANMVIPKRLLCDRLTPDRLSDVYGVFLFFRDKVMNEVMGWLEMQQPETSPTESSSSEPVTLHILSAS